MSCFERLERTSSLSSEEGDLFRIFSSAEDKRDFFFLTVGEDEGDFLDFLFLSSGEGDEDFLDFFFLFSGLEDGDFLDFFFLFSGEDDEDFLDFFFLSSELCRLLDLRETFSSRDDFFDDL